MAAKANGKAEKFKQLAERRVSVAIDKIRRLHFLARRGSYHYDPDQVEKMIVTLHREVDEVEAKFLAKKEPREQASFRFD